MNFCLQIPGSENVCMIISVYNKECPLHNNPTNVKSAEMWTTALKSATLTIRADKFCFRDNFYVSVIVLPDDYDCLHHTYHGDECHMEKSPEKVRLKTNSTGLDWPQRQKEVVVKIDLIMPTDQYVWPIVLAISLMIFLILISCFVILFKSYGDMTDKTEVNADEVNADEAELEEVQPHDEANGVAAEAEKMIDADDVDEIDGLDVFVTDAAYDFCQSCKRQDFQDEKSRRRLIKGLNRMKDNVTLADNTLIRDDVWFRRSRSKVYIYVVPLISLFYFVPAIQFSYQAKETEEMTGSMDLCYHNFKCARPLWIFSDFNHVISNISYVVFGLAFMSLAWIKTLKLPPENHPRNDHESSKGLLQQMSIFYAMGFALTAQGFFSVCYHVCPTNLSLQFDTTMMYMICMLCFVKIYQFRHPDATANAFSTMGLLGKSFSASHCDFTRKILMDQSEGFFYASADFQPIRWSLIGSFDFSREIEMGMKKSTNFKRLQASLGQALIVI